MDVAKSSDRVDEKRHAIDVPCQLLSRMLLLTTHPHSGSERCLFILFTRGRLAFECCASLCEVDFDICLGWKCSIEFHSNSFQLHALLGYSLAVNHKREKNSRVNPSRNKPFLLTKYGRPSCYVFPGQGRVQFQSIATLLQIQLKHIQSTSSHPVNRI